MASTSTTIPGDVDDPAKKNSVVIVDMPEDLINRDILKRHFEQYGTVERLACSVSKKYAVIHFSSAEEAENAAANGAKVKPDAPPLKIYNRSIAALDKKSPTHPPPPPPPATSSARLVTRRKIVRTFSGLGKSTTTSPPSGTSSSAPSVNPSDNVFQEEPQENPSSSMAGRLGHGPIRSSVKISRPSPFLRKKSFGDRSAKPSGSGTRNPFSLPPRGMLSLDRRKNLFAPSQSKPQTVTESRSTKAGQSVGESSRTAVANIAHADDTECSSSEIVLPDDDENSNVEVPEESEQPGSEDIISGDPQDNQQNEGIAVQVEPSSTFDVDETTEDAILNDDDDNDNVGGDGDDPRDEDYVPDDGECDSDTQDTAEATTEEEEGEIIGDDQEDEENNEDDGDVYESPLKRTEESSAKQESSTSSAGPFSFKLASGGVGQGSSSASAATSSSLFKLPFTSPFAIGNVPKPFSSSSFGIKINSSDMSKVFAGSSGSSSSSSTAKMEEHGEASKDRHGFKPRSSSPQIVPKKDIPLPPPPQLEKPKSSPFGLFSSFSSNKSSAAMPGTSSSSISFSSELKPSVFATSKSAIASSSTSRASSNLALRKTGGSTSFASTSRTSTPPIVQFQKDSPNPMLLTFNPDTPESQELFTKRSNTVEERYRILEARDKLIRARIPKTKVNVEQAKKLIGTCPDMCPEKERYMRQFQRQLVSYETLPGQDHVVDHQKAIKVYSRSSADQEEPLPHELRPGSTLDFTMHYLLRFIVPLGDNPDENLSDWYHFLWDRTRSIRKDITQQQIIDLTAVSLFEKCARFHIHCGSRLCELDVHSFDPKLNDENLMKCLQSLEHLYEDLRRRQVTCPNEPEFRAYQIMMNLNEGDALYNAQQLPGWILNSEQVQTALKLHHSVYTKNFVAFFKTVEGLPYMTACILHRYFFQVRSLALRCFVKAHCTLPKYETAMPLSTLQRMLGYGYAVQSFSYLCEAHGIHCDIEENKVILKRKLFYLPQFPSIYRESYLIDSKLGTSVAEAINGDPLPDIDIANRVPHSSFDEAGQLISGDIIGIREGKVTTFMPPESNVGCQQQGGLRGFSKQVIQPAAASGFSFNMFQQPKKEHLPPPKPLRQIETVCQDATAKLIEESVRLDVARLSQARLEEARKIQEQADRKRRREQIAKNLAADYIDRLISQNVESSVRAQSASRIRLVKAVEEIARNTSDVLIEESVLINLGLSARTELILAKEYHHRVLRILQKIFERLRGRFAIQKWVRFTRTKKLEREREEEKRREQLWNFPVINSYAMSTKDVFYAFCGKSPVQPSLNKADSLTESPDTLTINRARSKRKSDGEDGSPSFGNKVPRIEPELDYNQQEKLKQLWEFPAINPYSRTNREVLHAFCGSSSMNWPVSSKIAISETSKSGFSSSGNSSSFKIHKPAEKQPILRGVGQEIRQKANESSADFLKDLQNFLVQVKSENQQLKNLDSYVEGVEKVKKMYPELNSSMESVQLQEDDDNESQFYNESNPDWQMEVDDRLHSSILSGAFLEEGKLLQEIRRFSRQVKEEKAKSWEMDTFLNDMDLSFTS